jgi:hypothetical protein
MTPYGVNVYRYYMQLRGNFLKNTSSSSLAEQPSLEDSARLHPVFTFVDFAKIVFFTGQVFSLACNPQSGDTVPCIYVLQ